MVLQRKSSSEIENTGITSRKAEKEKKKPGRMDESRLFSFGSERGGAFSLVPGRWGPSWLLNECMVGGKGHRALAGLVSRIYHSYRP